MVFLVPGVILMGLSMAFSSPAWTALMAEPVGKRERGTTFGILIAPSVLTGIVAAAITWLLVGWKGLRIIFWTYFAATLTNFTIFIALQVLMSFCVATWVPAVLAYISDQVEETRRAEAIGKYSAFRRLMSFPAPTIGGILYDLWGNASSTTSQPNPSNHMYPINQQVNI